MQAQDGGILATLCGLSHAILRRILAALILFCVMLLETGGVRADHLNVDLQATLTADLVATLVLAGRIHPDSFPDIVRHNLEYFRKFPNTVACFNHLSSVMYNAHLNNPQENMRNRAIETWGGSVPQSVYEGMSGGGDPRALAAVQFGELANFIPSVLQGNDGPYRQSSFYQFTKLAYHYLAEISGYMAIIGSMPSLDPMEDWLNKYMQEVPRAAIAQMALTTYKDTYQTTYALADAAC